ncbi:hypothetical protein HMF7854_03600 [Sphingomonas ginkgonis]|uniref:Uncharacterized protein n=1 Tax=Sphingomonas ginkgonis TaxID=2315330 RepID=A0A429V7T0_9SPHN|nr:hypothetical protein [Sphingomonas ginkgonis]RST30013.1 hypothetical protein HMF7854_03600 [Sphingomonas ginkgonis]
MRLRRLAPAAALLAAACASTPAPAPEVAAPIPAPQPSGQLVGLSLQQITARFGAPAFQVREGPGLKLQWAGAACVLDAYLYAPASGGSEQVTHVDARRPDGRDTDQAGCATSLAR